MYGEIEVELCQAYSNRVYVRVSKDTRIAYAPLEAFIGLGTDGLRQLAEQGIYIIRTQQKESFLSKIDWADTKPKRRVIDTVGWNGTHFALPNARVLSAQEQPPPEVVFKGAGRSRPAGTLDEWLDEVATPLTGQSIAMFAICLAFAPPILRFSARVENIGFELCGAGGTGKSTVQRLMASVVGPPGATSKGDTYVVTADTTLNALEAVTAEHSDMPLIIDEASLFFAGESDSKRAANFKAMAFKLSAGTEKSRLAGGPARKPVRTAYLLSTNEPLASHLGKHGDVALAAADRLITIPIDPGRDFGVFDHLPVKVASASAFATSLTSAAMRQHGRPFPRFVRYVVRRATRSPRKLRAEIAREVARFASNMRVDPNKGSDMRVAEAFGLVYAAGKLAQDAGALPAGWSVGPAVAAVFHMHRHYALGARPFHERLHDLAGSKRVVPQGSEAASSIGTETDRLLGAIDENKRRRLLLIPAGRIQRAFPDWMTLRRDPGVRATLVSPEEGHLTVKRRLAPGGAACRVYMFDLGKAAGANSE